MARICEDCVPFIQGQGLEVIPLDGYEDHPLFTGNKDEDVEHECDDPSWSKTSLVTEDDGFDWIECEDCGIKAKRWGSTELRLLDMSNSESGENTVSGTASRTARRTRDPEKPVVGCLRTGTPSGTWGSKQSGTLPGPS